MKTRIFSLLLAALLIVALAVPVSAASAVTFNSKTSVSVADGTVYHKTDLFQDFKNVMPGDSRTETITISNKIAGSSYIDVCIQAIPHTDGTYDATLNGKNPDEMDAFLAQMTMTVKQGTKTIYSGPANKGWEMDKGVKINYNRSADLTVTLDVPIEMGNDFQDRLGEIDWVIYADIIEGKNLIQTGQLNWPIPVLATLGCALVFLGFRVSRKKKNA